MHKGRRYGRKHAPIVSSGGSLVIDNLLSRDWYYAMVDECKAYRNSAIEQINTVADYKTFRGGAPNRFLETAEGGPIQESIYFDAKLHKRLTEICGRTVYPSGPLGSYSYYDKYGHHLGLHRDTPGCDLTLITCTYRHDSNDKSGLLRIYPRCLKLSLASINDRTYYVQMDMFEGQSLLLLGGYVPHQVMPAGQGFARFVSVLCFRFI